MNAWGRRSALEVRFDGVDITQELENYLISLDYTDNETGEADDLQIRLQDRDGLWMEKWLSAAVEGEKAQAKSAPVKVGDVLYFSGTRHYTASTSDQGYSTRPGWGKVTQINLKGKHPYHLIHTDGGTNLYGWVDAADVGAAMTETGDGGAVTIRAAILRQNWNTDGRGDRLECGSFQLDAVECGGPPEEVTLKATSLSYLGSIRQTERSQAWESYTLRGIAGEMAARSGLALMYLAEQNPQYERKEQYRESDIGFLKRLCDDAGLNLKATGEQLVLFDQREYEGKTPVLTLKKGDGSYTSHQLSVGKAEVQYQACRVSCTDPATGACIEGIYKTEDWKEDGEQQRLEVVAKVTSIAQAEVLAEKRLRLHNKYSRTAEFTLPGNPGLAAGETVSLEDWGLWSGSYLITQARHQVSESGYTTSVSLRRILEGY